MLEEHELHTLLDIAIAAKETDEALQKVVKSLDKVVKGLTFICESLDKIATIMEEDK